jgi:hypothetical protein
LSFLEEYFSSASDPMYSDIIAFFNAFLFI